MMCFNQSILHYIDDVFQSIYPTVIAIIQKSLGKGSDWIIDSITDPTISSSKYNLLAGNVV